MAVAASLEEELTVQDVAESSVIGAPLVLVAEEDPSLRLTLVEALRHEGFRVLEAGDVMTFLDLLSDVVADDEGEHVDVVIADIQMPGIATFEALGGARRTHSTPTLICTAEVADSEALLKARRLGALAVIKKPVSVTQVLALCELAVLP